MSLSSTRFLIEQRIGAEPQGRFLHVFEDGEYAWSPDRNRALRFATEMDADWFGLANVHEAFRVVPVAAAALAVPDDVEDDEDDDFAAG